MSADRKLSFEPQFRFALEGKPWSYRDDGYFFNATLTLAMRNFPVSVSSLVNKVIQTNIPFGEDFLWNVSLIYTFNNKYAKI